jgi:hypothetical protein
MRYQGSWADRAEASLLDLRDGQRRIWILWNRKPLVSNTLYLKPISLILGLMLPLLASSVAAQDEYEQAPDLHTIEEAQDSTSREGIPIELRARSDTRLIVGSDFGSSDANLYWPRGSVRVGVPLSKRAAVRFRINGGAAVYDFDGTTDLFGLGPSSADPFDNLYSGAFAVEGVYRITETWGLFAQGFTTAHWEDGANFGAAERWRSASASPTDSN